jgi:hypothetical protein
MTYPIFSSNAPTGEDAKRVVSTNSNGPNGRVVGYPTNLDVYVQHLANSDGSMSVIETREVSNIVGNKLYLYHRPIVNMDGTPTDITVSAGTLDASSTNSSQAYVIFTSLPTSTFTVSYTATPDCDLTWSVNNLQNSVMEIEKVLGPNGDVTYPGIKNLKLGLFNNPTGDIAYGVLNDGVYLSHLNADIQISSSDDPTLRLTRGTGHTIQLGNGFDNILVDTDNFTIDTSAGATDTSMTFGDSTGDTITWKGSASGAGWLAVGGPEYAFYSGTAPLGGGGFTHDYYSGSALRVHGDTSFLGDVKAYGTITIVTTTGETSVVLGDWTVRDELFVEGVSHLIGRTETNRLDVQQNLHIDRDIIADNQNGSGGLGQSLVDGLDCSEIVHSYKSVTKSRHANTVISAPLLEGAVSPKNSAIRPWMYLSGDTLVGDQFAITGALNAAASDSGAHPHILQLLMQEEIVKGTYEADINDGTSSGVWSPGLMDPNSLRVRMLDGQAQGLDAPIYGYTVEETGNAKITRLNVFLPEAISNPPQTSDSYMLYCPGSVQYNTISTTNGTAPTATINASTTNNLVVSYEDEVRIANSSTVINITDALVNSISGLVGVATGIAYIIADSNGVDPENQPLFKALPVSQTMRGQTAIGEVVASYDDPNWSVLESTSYRPNGYYDSSWIPVFEESGATYTSLGATSGRCSPQFITNTNTPVQLYFNHDLGPALDIGNLSANLYVSTLNTLSNPWNQTHSPMYSVFGQDYRNTQHGLSGQLVSVPLGAKSISTALDEEASITYLDSTLIGINVNTSILTGLTVNPNPKYFRLIVNKNN